MLATDLRAMGMLGYELDTTRHVLEFELYTRWSFCNCVRCNILQSRDGIGGLESRTGQVAISES